MKYKSVLIVAFVLSFATTATANQVQSQANTLFVPGSRVPLSEFKNRIFPVGTTVMHVDPDIMAWIQANSATIQVAIKNVGPVQYVTPSSVDYTTGVVELTGPVTGRCVVTSSSLEQDLDIVTHWDASLNWDPVLGASKGGQAIGATDGLGTLDFDFSTMEPVSSADGTRNINPAWEHPLAGMYRYATDLYAIFSDGSGVPDDEIVPAFERYIAETYSKYAVTKQRAIWLSDLARETTGFPIAHRNHPYAFDPSALARQQVQNGLPLFQIVHCHLIDIGNLYPSIPGNENSLGTFILPPSWTADAPEGSYPILMNGFYDIHSSTFDSVGPDFLATLGGLYRHSEQRLAVGLLWNGGGANGTFTTQRSAYDNTNQLIQDAAVLLRANPEKVVFTGGSRGGLTALEMASNPYDLPYTAKFVNAVNPNTRLGDAIEQANPTYSLGMASIAIVTGYNDSWMSPWQEPGTGLSGRDLVKLNLFATTDTQTINDLHCPDSALYRDRLDDEGAGVVFRNGTHDYSKPFAHMVDYVHNLRDPELTVHLRFEIFYRAGHKGRDAQPDDEALLNMVFTGVTTFDAGTFHFAADPNDSEAYIPIAPDHIPLVYETPLVVGSGQAHTWGYVGEPGGRVQIWATQMPSGWKPGDAPPDPSSFVKVDEVVLSSDPGEELGTAGGLFQFTVPPKYFWWYEARYSPDGDTVFETVLGQFAVAAPPSLLPTGDPVVYISVNETIGGAFDTRTGGLSGDGEFLP